MSDLWARAGADDGRTVARRWWTRLYASDEPPIHPAQLSELDRRGALDAIVPPADVDDAASPDEREAYIDAFDAALLHQVRRFIRENTQGAT